MSRQPRGSPVADPSCGALSHLDVHTLHAVVTETCHVPRAIEGLHVAVRIGGAAGKIVLARRLIKEGMLMRAASGAALNGMHARAPGASAHTASAPPR